MNMIPILFQVANPFMVSNSEDVFGLILRLVLPLVVVTIIGIAGMKIFRNHQKRKQYPPGLGRPLGWFDIGVQNQQSLHGPMRKYDVPFMPEVKEYLKEIPYMEKVILDLEEFVKQKSLFVYEMRTSFSSGILNFGGSGKDIMIISTFQLESDEISYEEPTVEQGMFSSGLERRRNIMCHASSRYHDIDTPDGIRDVWVLAPFPIPAVGESRELGFVDNKDEFPNKSHLLQVKSVLQSENIAKVILYLEMVAIAEKKLESKNRQISELTENNSDLHDKIIEMQRQMDVLRWQLDEHKLVGTANQPFIPYRGEPWGWHIMFSVAPLVGYVLIPSMTRAIEPWMGAVLGMGIIIGVRFVTLRGQRRQDEQLMAQAAT